MARNLLQKLLTARRAPEEADKWVFGVFGIVADNEDPEHQHRVKVLVPSIDENIVFDKWATQMVPYVGPPGYGSFSVPEKGSEVVVFGALGQKHNLYYSCVYNEDYIVPADFRSTSVVGIRAPADLKLVAEGDLQLRAGGMQIETDGAINIIAPGGFFVNGKPV